MTASYGKIASIVPVAHLGELVDDTYFMALSHLCDMNPMYMEFYKAQVNAGKHVTLDNSTVELGHPANPDGYLENAVRMGASQVLLPDWLYDTERTLDEGDDFLRRVEAHHYTGRLMAVPQGRTDDEWLGCARTMLERWPVATLGISRRYTDYWYAKRLGAVQSLRQVCEDTGHLDVRIHLLGCQDRPEWDVAPSLLLPYVQGVDGSLAALFTMNGLFMTEGAERPQGSVDFRHTYRVGLLQKNLRCWRRLCAEGSLPMTQRETICEDCD